MRSSIETRPDNGMQDEPVTATAVLEPVIDDPVVVEVLELPEEVAVLLGEPELPLVALDSGHEAADGKVTLALSSKMIRKLRSSLEKAGNQGKATKRDSHITYPLSGFECLCPNLIIHSAATPRVKNLRSCSLSEHLFLTQQEMPLIQSLSEQIHLGSRLHCGGRVAAQGF